MKRHDIGAIILAAGLSSRMEDFKPLLRLGKRTLVEHCAGTFHNTGVDDIILVTGHNSDLLAEHGKRIGLKIVENKNHLSGMFSSVQAGVAALPSTTRGFFILPVDIPLVRPPTVKTILSHFKPSEFDAIIPCFHGLQGHPPLITSSLIPHILEFDGSGGLQALLADYACREITIWDRFIVHDADTPKDFSYLQEQFERREIPTRSETAMLQNELVPATGHIHGQLVGKIGVLIGKELTRFGYRFDLDLIYAGGCLHDLAKGKQDHAQIAAQKLRELGLTEVAETVEHHSSIAIRDMERMDERHLVCLADKYVSGTRITKLRQRYLDKMGKYQADPDAQEIIKVKMRDGLNLQNRVERVLQRPIFDLILDKL